MKEKKKKTIWQFFLTEQVILGGGRVTMENTIRNMSMFQTSSPKQSVSECTHLWIINMHWYMLFKFPFKYMQDTNSMNKITTITAVLILSFY